MSRKLHTHGAVILNEVKDLARASARLTYATPVTNLALAPNHRRLAHNNSESHF
jgi:hypothetical protein